MEQMGMLIKQVMQQEFSPMMHKLAGACVSALEEQNNRLAEHKAAARDYFKDPDNAERLQELARLINGEELADNH